MLVICLHCRRIVGCATEKGEPIDNCYHCSQRVCKEQVRKGQSLIIEVIVSRFTSCLMHDSPHIGFKQDEKV
jgi:hypothetical protein